MSAGAYTNDELHGFSLLPVFIGVQHCLQIFMSTHKRERERGGVCKKNQYFLYQYPFDVVQYVQNAAKRFQLLTHVLVVLYREIRLASSFLANRTIGRSRPLVIPTVEQITYTDASYLL